MLGFCLRYRLEEFRNGFAQPVDAGRCRRRGRGGSARGRSSLCFCASGEGETCESVASAGGSGGFSACSWRKVRTLSLGRMFLYLARQLGHLVPAAIAQRRIQQADIARALLRVRYLLHETAHCGPHAAKVVAAVLLEPHRYAAVVPHMSRRSRKQEWREGNDSELRESCAAQTRQL